MVINLFLPENTLFGLVVRCTTYTYIHFVSFFICFGQEKSHSVFTSMCKFIYFICVERTNHLNTTNSHKVFSQHIVYAFAFILFQWILLVLLFPKYRLCGFIHTNENVYFALFRVQHHVAVFCCTQIFHIQSKIFFQIDIHTSRANYFALCRNS